MSKLEPHLNHHDEPSLKPASDEVAVFQAKHKKHAHTAPSKVTPTSTNSFIGVKSTWGLRTLMTLVILAFAALVAGVVIPLKQQLDTTINTLQTLESQVNALNLQLERTGSTVDRSGKTIQARINELDFEIRKLWDLANKRNRRDIASLTQSVEAQSQAQAQLKQSVQTAATTLKSIQTDITQLNKRTDGVEKATDRRLSAVSQQQAQLRRELSDLNQTLTQSLSSQDLSGRISDNEQAIRAIDTYRRQVNTTLAQLKASVSALQSQLKQSSGN